MTDDAIAAANRKARDERKAAHLRATLERYKQQFGAAGEQGARSVAREAHAAIELVLDRDLKRSGAGEAIRCARGCSHCCRVPVEIWPHEAALLAGAARAAGMELDAARLERQSQYAIDDWQRQPAADRACVFLDDDGACRVYESRPNACRKLLVLSDPVHCDAGKDTAESVERWFSWEAEIMEAAALETFGAGLMPRLLLNELRRSGG